MSILARTEKELSDDAKTLFDWCKEGNVSKVDTLIDGHDVNTRDEKVRMYVRECYCSSRGVCVHTCVALVEVYTCVALVEVYTCVAAVVEVYTCVAVVEVYTCVAVVEVYTCVAAVVEVWGWL